MTIDYDRVRRLEAEPLLEDLARGFSAELADPAWLLGQQYDKGEQLASDASSPVRVQYWASVVPLRSPVSAPGQDLGTTPAEAIVESEPGDFWTPGRRIAAGRRVAAKTALPADPALLLGGLPVPYDVLNGSDPDGRTLWERRVELGLEPAWFGLTPPDPEPVDLWSPTELGYDATFTAASSTFTLRRHDGGPLDWYSVDADVALPVPNPLPDPVAVLVGRATYPGAPSPDWWHIEDATVDIGGLPPDRTHLATMLLVDLITSHADDWFSFPITVPAGHVLAVHKVVVHDSFGDSWVLSPPADGWSLFAVSGLDTRSLVCWGTAAALSGPVIDEVTLGVDEDANLLWAVERRIAGREQAGAQRPGPAPAAAATAAEPASYTYRAGLPIVPGWHPYLPRTDRGRREFVQARLADLSGPDPALATPPTSDLLHDPARPAGEPPHRIEPAAVPATGLSLERRAMLARRTDGTPVLWTQRSTRPLLTPPALPLRWDLLVPSTSGG